MNEGLALRVLGNVMTWSDDRAREEYAWLNLMSRIKYDDYRDFRAGVRFVESLAAWLQQFAPQEREVAYGFVRNRLVYFGPAEMKHLVELFYPEVVQRHLLAAVASDFGIGPYLIWSHKEAIARYKRLRRQCLFLSLSDGAHMDDFRRVNVGTISNEQLVPTFQVDNAKWEDLLKELRKDTGEKDARFRFVYAVDDFTASGTSLIRQDDEGGQMVWKGKMSKLWENIGSRLGTYLDPDYTLCVHHYIATKQAEAEVRRREVLARQERGKVEWFPQVVFTFGTVLPAELPVHSERDADFYSLTQMGYYDASLETGHTQKGGTPDVRLGFGGCALPLVLEHNTPNNSVALLWADTEGREGNHPMRPLFRRRQRHV